MDAFVDGDGPVDGIPRTDTSSSNQVRLEPDLMSFGASTTMREHTPLPAAPYRPPEDLLRSPTPSPNRIGAERSARRDTVNEYDRTAAATEQLGQRSAAAVRGGTDGYVDHRVSSSLDENERRELAFYRELDAGRVQEDVRRAEHDRQPDGQSPRHIRVVEVPERADVNTALDILLLDPKAVVTTGERKDINEAGETVQLVRDITPSTSIDEFFNNVRTICESFSGVTGGVTYKQLVTIALCDPHGEETANLLLHPHVGRGVLAALATVQLPEMVMSELLANAAASDQPFVLAAAAAAAVVKGSPVLAAIDLAAARALRLRMDPAMRREVAGAPTFMTCCNLILATKGNGWMPRAKRVAEEVGAPRNMVVTSATSFSRMINMLFADYLQRTLAPEQLGLTPEAAAVLRSLNGLPMSLTTEGTTMLNDMRLKVERAAAKPGFGERRLREVLVPLLTEYGEQGLMPGQYKTKPMPVGVNAVALPDVSKAPRKGWQSQQQKDKLIKSGAPPSDSARRLEHSTEPASGQRPAGTRSASPGGGQTDQRQTGNRATPPGGGQYDQRRQQPQPGPIRQQDAVAPRKDCDQGPLCRYLHSETGCCKNHSASDHAGAARAGFRDAQQHRAARDDGQRSPRYDRLTGQSNAQYGQHGGHQQQRGQHQHGQHQHFFWKAYLSIRIPLTKDDPAPAAAAQPWPTAVQSSLHLGRCLDAASPRSRPTGSASWIRHATERECQAPGLGHPRENVGGDVEGEVHRQWQADPVLTDEVRD